MRAVDWPLPSVIAGSLRTALGKSAGREFSLETATELQRVSVAGVFPTVENQIYLPAPQDCVVHPQAGPLRAMPLRTDYGGGDWPHPKLLPVMLSQADASKDFKPKSVPAWWPLNRFTDWMLGKPVRFDPEFLQLPEQEVRTHVSLQPDTGVAEDGQLFTTTGLALSHLPRYEDAAAQSSRVRFAAIGLATRVAAEGWCAEQVMGLNGYHPTGGERRLVHWRSNTSAIMWECPDSIRTELNSSDVKVRMALGTPAIFHEGWKPGWLDNDLVGSPPGSNVRLQLVGLTIQRWRAISGWSLAKINDRGQLDMKGRPGAKPVRRMVPAGGVYFFEVVEGQPASLADRWLHSVSDHEQDQRDGFGLATWGIWK
jgi:CRISPR-associated protein Cmr3